MPRCRSVRARTCTSWSCGSCQATTPDPLLVDGVPYIRHQNTTHPADWQRLHDLFAESAADRQDDLWDLHAPDLPRGCDGTSDGTVDSVVRSGLNVTVTRDAQWRPLAERTVTAFTDALSRSPLNATFPGPSVRITCLTTAITGGAERLSSLWNLLRDRSPRSGAGLAVARTG